MSEGVHRANKLNDLTNREWLRETKSFWRSLESEPTSELAVAVREFVTWLREHRRPAEVEALLEQLDDSFVYSRTPPRSALKIRHPATFSEHDVERLIRLFTKAGERVLDPFVGSGSTLVACARARRRGLGVELSEHWAQVARRRVREEAPELDPSMSNGMADPDMSQQVLIGDARQVLQELDEASFDFIVTSPPYWSILTKKPGLKVRAERENRGLPTHYSDDPADLGNIESYEEFLTELAGVFALCRRLLKPERYLAIIVSDFRHGPRFYLYHADLAARVEACGLPLRGVTILAQDNKNLYPFGVPHRFVSNIHHQYILVFQRTSG